MSVDYSNYLFIDLSIPHVVPMHQIVFCGLPGSTLFFHFIS